MKRYENRKNKELVKVVNVNKEENTISVEILTGNRKSEVKDYSLSSFNKNFKFFDEITEEVAQTEIEKEDMIKYLLSIIPEMVSKKVSSNGKLITLYINGKRVAYIYKRRFCLRFYIPVKIYENIRIDNMIYKKSVNKNEVDFYVTKENVSNVINEICKED